MASFSVVNNVAAANAQANLVQTNMGLRTALTRLSSGLRINNSGDDAAGLAVANSYRGKVAVLNQGIRNANDGLSTLQIATAPSTTSPTCSTGFDPGHQAASSSATVDLTKLNAEFKSVQTEIDREANVRASTRPRSSPSSSATMAPTASSAAASAADTTGLAIGGLKVDSAFNAASAVATIATAIGTLGTAQGNVGALENRLQFAIGLAQSQSVNNSAAESRIRDANIAEESASMTKFNILTQSGIAALSQANQSSQAVLSLLR